MFNEELREENRKLRKEIEELENKEKIDPRFPDWHPVRNKGVNIEGLARQRDLNKTANLADAAHSLASASVRENTKLYNELVKRVKLLEEMLQVHIGEKYWLVEEQANLRLNYNNEDRCCEASSQTGE